MCDYFQKKKKKKKKATALSQDSFQKHAGT
jgi:hypothetical protein